MSNLTPRLTDDGLGMTIKAMNGGSITFTKIIIGNGDALENVNTLKNLMNPLITIGIDTVEVKETYVVLTVRITSDNVKTGFYMKEMGVFAQDADGNECMYAYNYTSDETDYIPATDSGKTVELEISVYVQVSAAENVTAILTESAAYATKKELQDHLDDKSNPHGVTASDVGLGQVPDVTTDDQTPSFTEESVRTKIVSGERLSVMLGKIAKLFTDFASHLVAGNPHGIKLETIGAAASRHNHSTTEINSGTLGIARGGTGASSAAQAANNILASGASGIGGWLNFAVINSGARGIQGQMANNDYWRVIGAGDTMDGGYFAIDTADNGNEPIIVRQFTGVFQKEVRCLELLNWYGDTIIPGSLLFRPVPAGQYRQIGGVIGGTDAWRICFGSTGENGGRLYIDVGDDGTEPIIFRQCGGKLGGDGDYGKMFTSVTRELILLNESGNTILPGTIQATRFITSSSRKAKTNILDMDREEAEKLLNIRVVGFDYINGKKGCYGVIAEETEQTMDYPVEHNNEGEAYAVDYTAFIPYLIKNIQMLNDRIKILEGRLPE